MEIVPGLLEDSEWRDKALAWLTGRGVNNQGNVRSDNVASLEEHGLRFRSKPEIYLYRALKALDVWSAPLPVFILGGKAYQRIEPDFVIVKNGLMIVIELDGQFFHTESAAEADKRTGRLEDEDVWVMHVPARECSTPELAVVCAKTILDRIAKRKMSRG
ncbi:MAG: hypothetical protein EXR62_07880 [Chloroflexi bacterium]|nr:hypothetical protein [Chloroflexota bacterium]